MNKLIAQAWILAPCATILITALLGAVIILGSIFIITSTILKTIKFLIPLDLLRKKQEKKETLSTFEKDIKKFRIKMYDN